MFQCVQIEASQPIIYLQVALLTSLTQLLPPRSPTVSNPVPDSSLCRAAAPLLRPFQLQLPDCIRFSCCSPLASASAAAPRLRPLQLLLPDSVRFNCSSPIASPSTAAPHQLEDCSPCPMFSNILRRVQGSVN